MAKPAFHAGERAWHERTGVAARMSEIGPRMIRDFMPDQHRELFAELPFALLGVIDAAGQPRAILLAGPGGFIRSPGPRTLELRYAYASEPALLAALAPGMAVGLLGLQPHTRRRNRANGFVAAIEPGVLVLEIAQSFGNCPKHITPRHARFEPGPEGGVAIEGGAKLPALARHIIEHADTFFIASSASPSRSEQAPPLGADISHRGGPPGFVALTEDGAASMLLVPDYAGNFMFNTLGNLTVHPSAGLVFLDFEHGDVLALEADATIITDPERIESYEGAERLLELRVRSHRLLRAASPLSWA